MIVDFFTHVRSPETGFCDSGVIESTVWFYDKDNQRYLDLIAQRTKESDLAILISPMANMAELTGIPAERRFISYGGFQSGFIDSSDEERVRDVLKGLSQAEFRVNGAYYGICATQTALQVYLLTNKGQFLHPQNPDFQTKRDQVIDSEALKSGNVSYGIVYKPFEPLEPQLERIAKQLERGHTVVFESR